MDLAVKKTKFIRKNVKNIFAKSQKQNPIKTFYCCTVTQLKRRFSLKFSLKLLP